MRILVILCALALRGTITGGGLCLAFPNQMSTVMGLARNYWLTLSAPPGTLSTESNPVYNSSVRDVASIPGAVTAVSGTSADEWPISNRTLASNRYY